MKILFCLGILFSIHLNASSVKINPFSRFVGSYQILDSICKTEYPKGLDHGFWSDCQFHSLKIEVISESVNGSSSTTKIILYHKDGRLISTYANVRLDDQACLLKGEYSSANSENAHIFVEAKPMEHCYPNTNAKPGFSFIWNLDFQKTGQEIELKIFNHTKAFESNYTEDILIKALSK